jgi:hypothetical protein
MNHDNTIAHALHDIGLSAWFGGTLMGAIGLNAAASTAADKRERLAIANAGWSRWAPVNLAGIGAHLLGGTLLVAGNKGRLATQRGVKSTSAIKLAVTTAALAATGYSRVVGKKLEQHSGQPVDGTTEAAPETLPEVATAQRQEQLLQWVLPALTGVLVILGSRMSEQQRPQQVLTGIVDRLRAS